ncbi:MAG: orotidine 5-phosphate decarboxylase [Cenarchaeum symbiont of Oopsacas minuta]|nr:orotidine 5-phosphate decarboxylase [Cenarchaeum symbiont of Oopsacas minuta]
MHDCLILACDYTVGTRAIKSKIQNTIKLVKDHICAIKINFHLLLSINPSEIIAINSAAHRFGVTCIADIKLNDIGNTNTVALDCLEKMGFDAVIANPIMGKKALATLTLQAHRRHMGVISLCHMSAPEAKEAYETPVKGNKQLYELFLNWAAYAKVDGIIVGATYPKIISNCKKKFPRVAIYSPGVGVQGGDPQKALKSGTKYIITGRSIINSSNPVKKAKIILNRG